MDAANMKSAFQILLAVVAAVCLVAQSRGAGLTVSTVNGFSSGQTLTNATLTNSTLKGLTTNYGGGGTITGNFNPGITLVGDNSSSTLQLQTLNGNWAGLLTLLPSGSGYPPFGNSGGLLIWPTFNSPSAGSTNWVWVHGNFGYDGHASMDGGAITTDGNGNVTNVSTTGKFTGLASGLTNANGAPLLGTTNNSGTTDFRGSTLQYTNTSTLIGEVLRIGIGGKILGLAHTTSGGVLVDTVIGSGFSSTLPGPYQNSFGAMYTLQMTNPLTSAASMYELPTHESDIKNGMLKPILGVTTDDPRATPANPIIQSNYLYIMNVANYFNTSGVAGVLSNLGSKTFFLGDNGWLATNRDSGGNLQLLPGIFPGGVSNTMYQIHTNGMAFIAGNYYSSGEPLVGDTDFRCDITGQNQNSYPSQASSSAVTYTFPMFVPDKVAQDVKWCYTNFIDGVFVQDLGDTFSGMENYFHEKDAQFADAALFVNTSDSGRVYWKNYVYFNNFPHIDGSLTPGQFLNAQLGGATYLPHQFWIGQFENHASPELQHYANFGGGDQAPAGVGSDGGLRVGMEFIHAYDPQYSNYNAGYFPFISLNPTGHTSTEYSNYYAIVGEFNAISCNQMLTNAFGAGVPAFGCWETNQTPIATNAGFLSVWLDVEHYPRTVFDDYTNTVRIRKYGSNGQLAVLGVNQGTTTSNFNVSLLSTGADAVGSMGVVPNEVYTITNVYQNTYAGLLTNNLITNLPNANVAWVILTPYRLAVTNGSTVLYTYPMFTGPF